MKMKDLSIVIVNYKTPKLLLECISSIISETKLYSFEIIVVDNHSEDESESLIRKIFPDVNWVNMGYNSGFSRANNAGLKLAKGEYVLFLNSDTVVLNQALDKCLQHAKSISDLGFLGCKLLNEDRSHQNSIYSRVASFKELINYNPIYSFIKRRLPQINREAKKEIAAIMGAFLLGKTATIQSMQGFDSDFFMYSEEFELCNRLLESGKKLEYFEEAEVLHYGGASNGFSQSTERQRFISVLLLFLKIHGRLGLIFAIGIYKLNLFSEWVYYPFLSNAGKQKVIDGTANFFACIPYIFQIVFQFSSRLGNGDKLLRYIR